MYLGSINDFSHLEGKKHKCSTPPFQLIIRNHFLVQYILDESDIESLYFLISMITGCEYGYTSLLKTWGIEFLKRGIFTSASKKFGISTSMVRVIFIKAVQIENYRRCRYVGSENGI